MFGGLVGKLAGGLIGGALNAVGLGKIAPFVQLGINVMSGNWLGVAQDVASLVERFSGNKFLSNVAKQAPLGGFGSGGFEPTNFLTNNRVSDLFRGFQSLSEGFRSLKSGNFMEAFRKVADAFSVIKEFANDRQLINDRVSNFTNNNYYINA